MNSRQKEAAQAALDSEKTVIRRLKSMYEQSLRDINTNIGNLMSRGDVGMQHVVYQVEYQQALKKQITGILDTLHAKEFNTVSEYLEESYTNGFVGTMYDLHGQGIPLCFPIDERQLVNAITTDSKINEGLYKRLGQDVTVLKRKIQAQVSRGIATGMSYEDIAKQLDLTTNVGYNNAVRIARTEGHRIQIESSMDACKKAHASGADVVKQWDATLDNDTRKSHREVDGEIRELDETFSNGLRYPGDPRGGAGEVCNCRCALLQRARWALDEDELQTLKERAAYFGLDKSENFEDFKIKFLQAAAAIAETAAEASGTAAAAAFKPAGSIADAEEYAGQFVTDFKTKYTGNVSYKGIDLEYANSMNKVLAEVNAKFDVEKLGNIQPMNFRDKKFKGVTADAGYTWGNGGTIHINGHYYASGKTLGEHIDEAEKLLQNILEHADEALKNPKLNSAQKTYIKALQTSKRQIVAMDADNYAEATFVHEIGHMLDDKIFKLQMTENADFIKGSMREYAERISGYAVSDSAEYVAESFTLWWYGGGDKIDPKLAEIFERNMKK